MIRENINENWRFARLESTSIVNESDYDKLCIAVNKGAAKEISLPHTWHNRENPYYGTALYEKELCLSQDSQSVYLEFEGVEQRCLIFLNGRKIGSHKGSYATFRAQVPADMLSEKKLCLQVFVDNTKSEELAPCFGDFSIFGGIYRNVNVLYSSKESFDYMYYGTNGIIVRTSLKDGRGIVRLEPHTTKDVPKDAVIDYEMYDPNGEKVGSISKEAYKNTDIIIDDPVCWNGKGQGYCYILKAILLSNGQECDSTSLTIGFRKIDITPDEGLFLNGRNYRLNGVAKHQDFGVRYNAVTEKEIRRDFEIIDEIGANAVRLSHYQHPQLAYDICDREGLLVWAEIPMLKLSRNEKLFESTCEQLKELILQNIHHPSIFCFGIQNEIAMFRDDEFMHELCKKLSDIVHELDSERFSAGANLYSVKPKSTMNEVSDIVGYNLYFGWYYGEMEDYRKHLDLLHDTKPDVPYGISEYGVDTNINLHSENPMVKDYSEEYQALFHETVYPIFEEKKYLWGSFVWNMFDFNSAIRNEGGIKGLNQKGLVTADRQTRKDAFYYYKAKWSDEKVLHICSKRFAKRDTEKINIKAYSTEKEATLFVNGKEISTIASNDNMTFLWKEINLEDGVNDIKVKAGNLEDSCTFEKVTEKPKEYSLPEDNNGGMVRNWFLSDDDLIKEGFLSVKNRADEIINDPQSAKIIKEMLPDLYRDMTEKDEIPLGLEFLSILQRALGSLEQNEKENKIKEVNERLHMIPDIY